MTETTRWILTFFLVIFAVAASYGFAINGEPQSFWLWHHVLGVL